MATLKNVTIDDTGYLKLPVGNAAERPPEDSNNIASMRVNSDNGKLEYWNGVGWELSSMLFPFRTIITTAFMQGGYKNSAAWNNVNKCIAATDTTTNLGDGATQAAFNYQWGACSKDYAYIFGAGGGHAVSSNYTTAFNMRTETQASDISRNLALNRHNFGGIFQEHYATWMAGGADGRIEEYNLTTKSLFGTIGPTTYSGSTWGMSHENYGIFYTGNNGNTFTFATRTNATRGGTGPGSHHQQKSVNSKYAFSWAGNEGSYNGGNNFRRTNWATNSTSGTVAKPVGNCGEENYTMGNDHQYMLGMYNGLQNNISWRFNYATESGFQGGASMEPKGKAGSSSGMCAWRD